METEVLPDLTNNVGGEMFEPTRREFLTTAVAAAAFPLDAFGQSPDLATLTIRQASDLVRRRKVSALELTEACLRRIDAYNPALNAFVTVAREHALDAARDLDAERRRGRWRGPLHGIPIALKDNIDTAGIRTTGASALFKDRVPEADAHVAARLRQAGAVILGKLNLHEFACPRYDPGARRSDTKHSGGGVRSEERA